MLGKLCRKAKTKTEQFKYAISEKDLTLLNEEIRARHYKNLIELYEIAQEHKGYDVLYYGFIHYGRFCYTHHTYTDNVDEFGVSLLQDILNEALTWLIDCSGLLDEEYSESFTILFKDGTWRIYNIHGTNLINDGGFKHDWWKNEV